MRRPRLRTVLGSLAGVSVIAVGCGEVGEWQASRRLTLASPLDSGSTCLIVLGFPSRSDGSAGSVQRWRVSIARRTWQAVDERGLVVFSGGFTKGRPVSEAATMADLAVDQGWLDPADVMLEQRATTTWENIEFSLPFVEDCDQIVIVSDGLHANRAARYLVKQRPDLADRLAGADSYRFGEAWWIKPFSLADAVRRAIL